MCVMGILYFSDVLKYLEGQSTSSGPSVPSTDPSITVQSYVDMPLNNMRKTIAKRLTQSKVSRTIISLSYLYAKIISRFHELQLN